MAAGWDPKAIEAYERHYAATNPFAPYWASLAPNRAVVAGRDAPSIGSYANSEFIADWLDPQGDLRGASGIRIGRSDEPAVTFVSMHYPTRRKARYDTGFAVVLDALGGRISMVQSILRNAVLAGERIADRTALLERMPAAAFVVRADGVIRDMCPRAAAMLEERAIVHASVCPRRGERLAFADGNVARWFGSALARVCAGDGTDADRRFASGRGAIRARLARLPASVPGVMSEVFGAPRALLLVDAPRADAGTAARGVK